MTAVTSTFTSTNLVAGDAAPSNAGAQTSVEQQIGVPPVTTTTVGTTAAVAALGAVTNATPGVAVVRSGQRMPVDGSHALQEGDHVTVPEGGHATITFPASATNKSALSGRLTGGSDAIVVSTKLSGGMEEVDVDLMSGDLVMISPYAVAEDTALPTNETAASAGGIELGDFALGALGVVALGAALVALNGDDSDNNSVSSVAASTSQSKASPATAVNKSTPARTGAPDSAVGTEHFNAVGEDKVFSQFKSKSTSRNSGTDVAYGAFWASGQYATDETDNQVATLTNGESQLRHDQNLYLDGPDLFALTGGALDATVDGASGFLTPVIDDFLGLRITAGQVNPLEPQIDLLTDGVSALMHDNSITLLPVMLDGNVVGGNLFTAEFGLLHSELPNAPLLTMVADRLGSTPSVPPAIESIGSGLFHVAPTSPVTSSVSGDLAMAHLAEPASGLIGSSSALSVAVGPEIASLAAASTQPVGATTPAIDMLHAGLISPITSTVQGGNAMGLLASSSHVLHGMAA